MNITNQSIEGTGQHSAVLLVLLEPPASLEEEFNDWYDLEHFPQRMRVPGFVRAERWVALSGWPRYLARYDLADTGVLDSPEYLAISGPNNSPWSKRILPRTIGRRRLALPVVHRKGSQATASCLCLISWPLDDDQRFETLLQQASERIDVIEGVIDVQWCRNERLAICLLGFDYIIAQQDIRPLSRLADNGSSMMNIYVRYQR